MVLNLFIGSFMQETDHFKVNNESSILCSADEDQDDKFQESHTVSYSFNY